MLHYLFRAAETMGDEAWKDATFPLNSLVMAVVSAALAIFWGVQVVYQIFKSQGFRGASGRATGKGEDERNRNQLVLVKFVVWLLFTNLARAGFCFLRVAKSSDQYKFVSCMHTSSLDYAASVDECQHFIDNANWRFITEIPVVSIGLSVTDLLCVPLLKFCHRSS